MKSKLCQVIVGIDEVGRGSWAGPLLVVAACATAKLPKGLADSKSLTKIQREQLYEELIETCRFGEGWVQPEEIDEFGLAQAMRIAVSRALIMLAPSFRTKIIMDGKVNYCPNEYKNVKCLVRADALKPIVSAAGIYAKVKRDKHMADISRFYPDYNFEKHVGYGTADHLEAIKTHGICPLHRKSFKPIKAFI